MPFCLSDKQNKILKDETPSTEHVYSEVQDPTTNSHHYENLAHNSNSDNKDTNPPTRDHGSRNNGEESSPFHEVNVTLEFANGSVEVVKSEIDNEYSLPVDSPPVGSPPIVSRENSLSETDSQPSYKNQGIENSGFDYGVPLSIYSTSSSQRSSLSIDDSEIKNGNLPGDDNSLDSYIFINEKATNDSDSSSTDTMIGEE